MTEQETINSLMMNQTLAHIALMAQGLPFDPDDSERMKAALSIGMMGLIEGIENNQVTFHDDETKTLTYGLLSTVMVEIHGKVPILEEMAMN